MAWKKKENTLRNHKDLIIQRKPNDGKKRRKKSVKQQFILACDGFSCFGGNFNSFGCNSLDWGDDDESDFKRKRNARSVEEKMIDYDVEWHSFGVVLASM